MSVKTAFTEDCLKYFTAHITQKSGASYRSTRCIGVAAKSTKEAIELIETQYAGYVVVNINHIGAIDVI